MIPQYESTGEWVQRIEEQKRSEPSKKIKKELTGILKDLSELKRYWIYNRVLMENENGSVIKVSDVEEIINKYSHP